MFICSEPNSGVFLFWCKCMKENKHKGVHEILTTPFQLPKVCARWTSDKSKGRNRLQRSPEILTQFFQLHYISGRKMNNLGFAVSSETHASSANYKISVLPPKYCECHLKVSAVPHIALLLTVPTVRTTTYWQCEHKHKIQLITWRTTYHYRLAFHYKLRFSCFPRI